MAPANSVGHLADERSQHLLRDFEIVNRAAADGPVHFDAARLAAEQLQRFMAHGNHRAVVAIDCHHRRLVQKNAAVWLIDEGVDSPEIDGELVLKKLFDELHGDGSSSRLAGSVQGRVTTFEWQLVCLNKERLSARGMSLEVTKDQCGEDSSWRMTSVRRA